MTSEWEVLETNIPNPLRTKCSYNGSLDFWAKGTSLLIWLWETSLTWFLYSLMLFGTGTMRLSFMPFPNIPSFLCLGIWQDFSYLLLLKFAMAVFLVLASRLWLEIYMILSKRGTKSQILWVVHPLPPTSVIMETLISLSACIPE